ncbi:MAG: RloB domain-containing protein [Candidatus Omnitrophica bacterium]|nr:RloB domain-containing protein [Candidatus Omnitrophota bacterium]
MPPNVDVRVRRTKTAILIVGEGPTEKAFLQYLQEIYISREADVAVKIECGSGGSPQCVVEKTMHLRDNRAYDRCAVVLDAHIPLKPDRELKKLMKKRPPVEIILISPCIEGLFLTILQHPNFSRNRASVQQCKHEFEAHYLSDVQKTDKHSYGRIFPRHLLDSCRGSIRELDTIFKAMQV